MPTIPTGKLERELRRLYMRWVHQLPKHERDLHSYVATFQQQSTDLIEKMGGDIARLGVLADFPAPRRLDLSLHVGTIYSDMELAAISAQIGTGLNPTDTARALVRAGVDKSYRRLERLARTETVRAYWKNAWDSIDGLGLVMVWGAESGPRTCEWCKERDGLVMDSPELRDHPNGRCTPIPVLPSRVDYRGSIRADGVIYQDLAWSKKRKPGELSGQEKIDNAKAMYGTDSPQYEEAKRRFGTPGQSTRVTRNPTSKTPPNLPISEVQVTPGMNLTNAQKLQNTAIMFGTHSPQYRRALKLWGPKT